MVSFLFWNLAENPKTFPVIRELALTLEIDVFLFAECPKEIEAVIMELNQIGRGVYRIADRGVTKVRGISRLPVASFVPRYINSHGDMTIWKLMGSAPNRNQVQIAVVHLLSKAGGVKSEDQQAVASIVSREISEYEDSEGSQDTILVGDLNMNPFEPGMVLVAGFNATMTKRIARTPARLWRAERYRRFYNPMWGFFGDQTPGPPGTHYWDSSVTGNHLWHVYDQVLLRPARIDRVESIRILDRVGQYLLVREDESPAKSHLSDHLPILFDLIN